AWRFPGRRPPTCCCMRSSARAAESITPKKPRSSRRAEVRAPTRMALLSIATSLATLSLKFAAYFLTGAVSLWSDALEALVNVAAGLVALGAVTLAARPADERHAYGHDKAEYFSSGVEGALIVVASVSIIWSALTRLHT